MTSNEGNYCGSRKFHDIPKSPTYKFELDENDKPLKSELLQFIREDIIGHNNSFVGPYGKRKIVYCDHIASSRALNSIEDYVKDYVLSNYGNTHTTTTVTSLQSSMFQQEARTIIRNCVRADEHDAVIFSGSGVTSAVHKLIHGLDLNQPPVVFVGPFEHHSNLLPWREIAAHVVSISETADGGINMEHLEAALSFWKTHNFQMIGCFSAASNITGLISDTLAVSSLLHKYGALAFWDYATGGPYLDINMHPKSLDGVDSNKDAVFLSMHKFIGGVDAPGVLIAKRSLFKNKKPSGAGGGSVFFVGRNKHRYLQDEEMREEGGTPPVVGIVRAGLAFQLKQTVGVDVIMRREEQFYSDAMKEWEKYPNLHLLGHHADRDGNRLAVFSFMIFHPETKLYLHHNYVAALLNDVFGIQARGGCACAGPYAQELLGIDEFTADQFEDALLEDSRLNRVHLRRINENSHYEVLRPGFTRLNIPYFASADEARYVIRAVAMVSEVGWRCLPSYKFNPETGEWRHMKHKVFADRLWLGNVRFTGQGLKLNKSEQPEPVFHSFDELLQTAENIFDNNAKENVTFLPDHSAMFSDDVKHLRWFLLPSEALLQLTGKPFHAPQKSVVNVRRHVKQLSMQEIKETLKVPDYLVDYKTDAITKPHPIYNTEVKTVLPRKIEEIVIDTTSITCCVRSDKNNQAPTELKLSPKFISPPKRLFKLTLQAIEDFNMIESGDRVLVCLSGGKDSLSLLHVLHQYQFYSRSKNIPFELGAVTIDPMSQSYDPSPLIPYLKSLNVTYFYEKQDIMNEAIRTSASSICAFCSRMKRGRIYACARREGWNVLAFGQHLDDLAESFVMSAFHNGLLRTMKANYLVKEGDLRVIRPFAYVRETDTRQFAEGSKLPVIPENCPACFEAPKERHRVKQLLASQEILHPRLFPSLKEAIYPLMAKNKTGMESTRNDDFNEST